MDDAVLSSPLPPDPLRAGDTLARSGRWVAAWRAWTDGAASDPALQGPVRERLAWMISVAGGSRFVGSRTARLAAAFGITTLLAVAFVAVAGEPGSPSANAWAVAAWIMILAATATAILAAGPSRLEPFDRLARRAEHVARALEARATGDTDRS